MAPQIIAAFLVLQLCWLGSGMKDVQVGFDDDGYHFNIYVEGELWFRSGVLGIRHQGMWWSNEHKDAYTLQVEDSDGKVVNGRDSIGEYGGVQHVWKAFRNSTTPSTTMIETSVLVYNDLPVISFDVVYLTGLTNNVDDDESEVGVASSFPSFVVDEGKLERGWMTWSAGMASHVRFGNWSESDKIYGAVDGGYPLVVFDSKMRSAVVLSPLTSFMTALQTTLSSELTNDSMVTFGPFSTLNEVPAGYRYRTLLVAADNVTSAMKLYGETLMKHYGKSHSYRKADYSINYLGYWTDHGGCYHYYDGKYNNYEDLLLDVKKYADEKQLPYRYLQLDSWWYFKGKNNGVKNWTAMPDVFPNGIQSLQNKTKWPIVAHNRFWSPETDYADKYNFIVEKNGALPDDPKFWDYLISTGVDGWRMITYEQDWLDSQFGKVDHLKWDILLGERWLKQMAESAKNLGVTIQYCMPWPRHVLQSVMNPVVTQIRVSGDYAPDNEQWKVGESTILSHFIGLAVFKDNFRSTTNQSRCSEGNLKEKYPMLEAYTSAMTGGPVGPSDMIGKSNRTIIMATCMTNGRLLKPTYPTISLDSTFLRQAFGREGPMGQLNAAYTEIEDNTWYFVMGAELAADYALSSYELPPSSNTFPATRLQAMAFQYNVITGKVSSIQEFTEIESITVEACGKADFKYIVVAPRFYNGMYLFGELDKFVPVSEQRFVSYDQTLDEVYFRLAGVPEEVVEVTVYDGQATKTATCVIRDDYYAELTITKGSAVCV